MLRWMVALLLIPGTADPDTGRRTNRGPVTVEYLQHNPLSGEKGRERLKRIGVELKTFTPAELAKALKSCDVLYLPSEWATSAEARKAFRDHRDAVREFVERGGAIFVAQPNVDVEIDELPLKFQVANQYDRGDSTESRNEILRDLRPEELPYPSDRILSHDPKFEVAAVGKSSASPSLLLARIGRGRMAVCTDNDNIVNRMEASVTSCHMSDACLKRILEWLVRRAIPTPKAP